MTDRDICILSSVPRGRKKEADISLTSKTDFIIHASPDTELQRALHVSPGGGQGELQFWGHLRIARDTPFSPDAPPLYGIEAEGVAGSQPLIALLAEINYSSPEEVLLPSLRRYPLLDTLLKIRKASGSELGSVTDLARQIAPALNVSSGWDDPVVRRSENSWKEAKIEEEQYFSARQSGQGAIIAVRDADGFIRHLILRSNIEGETVYLPLTFAQHCQFRQPLVCYFAFTPRWWLVGSEQLKLCPEAKVWLTNTLDCQNPIIANPPRRIFLSYLFGREMIPHLELDCLRWREVEVQITKGKDAHENRRNVEEGLLLMSRLKGMDIKAEFMIVDEEEPTYRGEDSRLGDIVIPSVISCYNPHNVSINQVVRMAKSYDIEIPENLRPDRYGALIRRKERNLVADFLNSGEVTAVTLHTGVDLALVACSIAAGMRNGGIFPGKWTCGQKINPALFIKGYTDTRHRNFFEELSADNFPLYEIPGGSRENIEHHLYHIVKEKGFNVLIFESRQIVQEYRKELQIACEWAHKHSVETIIITTQEDRSAEAFFSDICGRDIHLWWPRKIKNEYIVEDRPLLVGHATAFKITFSGQQWTVQDHAEDELLHLEDRNVQIPHVENETSSPSLDPILNYRSQSK